MKILFHVLNFSPELIGCGKYNGEMADWLASRGHEVKIITTPPYYPEWKIPEIYKTFHFTEKSYRPKMKILRCPFYVPSSPTGTKRLLHLSSFAISSSVGLLKSLSFRPDLVFTVAPTILSAPAALFYAKLTKAKSWLHIQDFELEAAFKLGILKGNKLGKFSKFFETKILERFDLISTISENMVKKLKNEIPNKKTFLFPNWIDSIRFENCQSDLRQYFGFKENDIVCLYSGNIGEKQGLEVIIKAASLLSNYKQVKFLICGNGPNLNKLKEMAQSLENISFSPLLPYEDLPKLLNSANINLLPQRKNAADLVMPSKLLGMMASGKPIIAAAEKEAQLAITLEDKGILIKPECENELASAIKTLLNNEKLMANYGKKAKEFVKKHFFKEKVLMAFEQQAQKMLETP
jgi:colanic acid biosynthesis glycosyl transferase WcaI